LANNYNPFERGYVKTLAQPGANVTGMFYRQQELASKQLEPLTYENRWRIQRFGTEASIIDPLTLETTNVAAELSRLAEVLGHDADALDRRCM
jgi:gamma-glutamyl:cysteine ligase YbdK (ATP-grasp superfamily)